MMETNGFICTASYTSMGLWPNEPGFEMPPKPRPRKRYDDPAPDLARSRKVRNTILQKPNDYPICMIVPKALRPRRSHFFPSGQGTFHRTGKVAPTSRKVSHHFRVVCPKDALIEENALRKILIESIRRFRVPIKLMLKTLDPMSSSTFESRCTISG